ncbi:MAG: 6-phosphogluconolactonase [Burkholderiales bacterium]|nr:6-phosphogluconolactonase [Burkholderiales bacterium]
MNLLKFNDNYTQAESLAQSVSLALTEIIKLQGYATLAVSGGKSPILFLQLLSKKSIEWNKVTITLVDERFTDVKSEDSNENMVRKNLLINNAETAFFTGLVTTRDIIGCITNANLQIKSIDVIVLGMGDDGHTASIFPCCNELDHALELDNAVEKYVVTKPISAKYQRIGLSLYGILDSKKIFVSISGLNKLNIITEADAKLTKTYPISYVLANKKSLDVYWHN